MSGGTHPGVAVVELFTSEGCSSCPPADDALVALDRWARHDGLRVYPLSFHVTYWNRLGWSDPFSQAAFTARQQDYAAHLGRRNVFTPQAIVNGRLSLNGSHADDIRSAVRGALSRGAPARVEVTVHARDAHEGQAVVSHRVTDAPRGAALTIALTESGVRVDVPRGENRGRSLRHDHVVRVFRRAASLTGETVIALPPQQAGRRLSVVAVLAHTHDDTVYGADRVDL